MPVSKKVVKENGFYADGITSEQVKDRGNDPYFVKKAEDAKEFLRKHPLPNHLKK